MAQSTSTPRQDVPASSHRPQGSVAAEPQFRVWIRLPFPRGDFVDPPQVNWDTERDQQLWAILSRTTRGSDLDWNDLSKQFNVTVPFILQQAAWLYERQLSSVRDQIRRVNQDASPASIATVDAQAQRDSAQSATPTFDGSMAAERPQKQRSPRPLASPQIDNGTDTLQSPSFTATAYGQALPMRPAHATGSHQPKSIAAEPRSTMRDQPLNNLSSSESSTSESDEEDEGGRLGKMRSKAFKRPAARFGASRHALFRSAHSRPTLGSEPSDREEAPPFLAFRRPTDELTATLKGRPAPPVSSVGPTGEASKPVDTDSSLASSNPSDAVSYHQRDVGSIASSPEAQKKGRSAAAKRAMQGQTSDGSPIMGSSFSDLDDTSVTQSALEEALLSNMQRGGSRLSTAFTKKGE